MSDSIMAAIIGALTGGAVAALITAWSQSLQARRARREAAAKELWKYHYTLAAYAAQAGSHAGPREERTLLSASLADVTEALRNAYPYAGFIRQSASKRLFFGAWFMDLRDSADSHSAAEHAFDEFDSLANQLELELMRAFPQRPGDRCRAFLQEHRLKRAA